MTLDTQTQQQITQCVNLLKDTLGQDLLGVYLYGSAVASGLQKFSDIDLFAVTNHATTLDEKQKLVNSLLQISGIYMQDSKLPIELTIVVASEINPWHYPPNFDFQYGEWLRTDFESGITEPWTSKVMPDLALLITQLLIVNVTLFGSNPNQLFSPVPYCDCILAMNDAVTHLKEDLNNDTRNVLLTYARIWCSLETHTICSKSSAAEWTINRLTREYQPVLERAKLIYLGEVNEYWDDIQHLIQPCADFMLNEINLKLNNFLAQ